VFYDGVKSILIEAQHFTYLLVVLKTFSTTAKLCVVCDILH